ncbi:hypothetical protein PUN28_018615 [Cardiocondyla obscurior]|uniref:Uncharacterized protein n=1 Tax=Cardiocondyla obscurior TaxID=286306 RepID=A0AAW2EIL4_9HYME
MIKRARTTRDFLDTFHSSTLEHRSIDEKLLPDVDFDETFDYFNKINFIPWMLLIISLHVLLTSYYENGNYLHVPRRCDLKFKLGAYIFGIELVPLPALSASVV